MRPVEPLVGAKLQLGTVPVDPSDLPLGDLVLEQRLDQTSPGPAFSVGLRTQIAGIRYC